MRVLITGAAGYIGHQLLEALAARHPDWSLVAADIRPLPASARAANVEEVQLDIAQPEAVDACIAHWQPQAIVHLASVVTPPPGMSEATLHAIDVEGTRAVVTAAAAHGVGQLVVTSSGAAYGYYPENAEWIDEADPLRGHDAFAYARHKREVEELLAEARERHPQLRQLVLRPGTILGRRVDNQITALFDKPSVMGVRGHDSRFVFIWDQDVVAIILQGLERGAEGIYNLAGDGALSMAEIAAILGKPYRPLPATLILATLALLKPLGLTRYGPEQLDFLRYRPVLDNRRLKEEFGYQPQYSSREAFLAFLDARGVATKA
ncbi:NAD-dependent epimerase/dehydratase family protein [Pseudomonas sp. PDM13]|uniref:NAD-dependent epimerase/dehydratase family protein n=1 Tax=Pseudomonas sp. PDM13 TaxID=2769255 RepID=UPI0021E09081|nr:NAD-dependent epimerase/dehydratase family protein [Pseudomonas sp. PDM13]MCU9946343.1 NAD-dependent epimerase/dehydratase family protein [Pseudomonas sp. PDM13]